MELLIDLKDFLADVSAAHPWVKWLYLYVLGTIFFGAFFAAGNPGRDD